MKLLISLLLLLSSVKRLIKIDKEIQKKKDQFTDPNNMTKLQQLKNELVEVNKILTEDFELMMDRDRNLNSIDYENENRCGSGG